MDDWVAKDETIGMKIVPLLWGLVAFASAQVVVPEKGWKRLEEGDGETMGERYLGAWENDDKTVIVGVTWAPELPDFNTLLGFESENEGVDPSDWPKDAEVLGGKKLGVKIDFGLADLKKEERTARYWIYGEKGGLLLIVYTKKGTEFLLEGWDAEGIPEDKDWRKRKEMKNVVTWVKTGMIRPTIKIDPRIAPPVKVEKKEGKILVELRAGGDFWFEGKEVKEEDLVEVLKAAVMKFEKKDPVIEPVLHVRAAKEVEFKYVRRVIKAAAKAGVEQVAYASFARE